VGAGGEEGSEDEAGKEKDEQCVEDDVDGDRMDTDTDTPTAAAADGANNQWITNADAHSAPPAGDVQTRQVIASTAGNDTLALAVQSSNDRAGSPSAA
jgi:hypothetical protein